MILGTIIGFVLGVVATVLFNIGFPAKIDKASREISEEASKVRKTVKLKK